MNELGLDRITPSGLMMYDSCPRAFFYIVWLGIKLPQPQVHLKFGTAIHNALDLVYQGNYKWEGSIPENILSRFENEFTIDCLDDILSEPERIQKYSEMLADGKEMLRQYWGMKEVIRDVHGIKPIEFELKGKDILFNPDTKEPWLLPLSYRLDARAENDCVVEFKTSSKEYDIFETRGSMQALSYSLAYYCKYGVIPTIHYLVLIKKRKKDKIQHLEIKYRLDELSIFDKKVRSILEGIKNREFSKPLKDHPYFCDCKKIEDALNIK